MSVKHNKDKKLLKEWSSLLEDIIINKNFKNISGSLGCSVLLLLNRGKNKPEYVYYIVKNSIKKMVIMINMLFHRYRKYKEYRRI